jgi:hypothetical protein
MRRFSGGSWKEISGEGRPVRAYRHGGRGLENVLTAEVLLPLSYLPRSMFLDAVIRAATGAEVTRAPLVAEITQAEIVLLSETFLAGTARGGGATRCHHRHADLSCLGRGEAHPSLGLPARATHSGVPRRASGRRGTTPLAAADPRRSASRHSQASGVVASVQRLCESVITAIDWHS